MGLPQVCTASVPTPLLDLVARYARTHGPFLAGQAGARYGVSAEVVRAALDQLVAEGRVVRGEFRPDGVEREWCDDEVLRQLRRRSLAALRREVEPVDTTTLARFPIDPLIGIDDATAQRIVTSAGFDAEIAQKVAAVLPKLWRAFYESDGTLVEINPWCARRPTRSSPSTRKPRSTA